MKRIILTGATGFVGANLARRLLMEGHEVHALVRPEHGYWRIDDVRGELHLHDVNLVDGSAVHKAVAGIGPDWVFHLAAYGAYPTQSDLATAVHTNFLGTLNITASCLSTGVELMVNTGSSSEYGLKDHAPRENEPLEPNSSYALTKAASTMLCRYVARSHGVRMPTLRLYSVYGPFEEPTRFMPTIISWGLEGKFPPLADPATARDYIHVDDVCDAYLTVAATPDVEPGAVYNVGTGVQTTLQQVVELAARTLRIPDKPAWRTMPSRSWDTTTWVCDSTRLQKTTGWSPRLHVETGFGAMVDWIRNNPALRPRYARQSMLRP